MKGLCAIDAAKDKTFFSLASLRNKSINFIEESSVDIAAANGDIIEFFRENFEAINERIRERENAYSLKVRNTFVNLPDVFVQRKTAEEVFPLRVRKKITTKDITMAKKHLEEISLDWNDHCINNIVLDYNVDGQDYDCAPLGIEAKKIKIRSLLISVKDKLYKDTENIFSDSGRAFGGFVVSSISTLFTPFSNIDGKRLIVVVDIGYDKTRVIAYKDKVFIFDSMYEFGLKEVIGKIQDKFGISAGLAEELFNNYGSFKQSDNFKEISVRDNDRYINLNIKTLNSLIASNTTDGIKKIVDDIGKKIDEDFVVSFIGRLSVKANFYDHLKESLNQETSPPSPKVSSVSLGCLRYGFFNYFERYSYKSSILGNIIKIYKEYF